MGHSPLVYAYLLNIIYYCVITMDSAVIFIRYMMLIFVFNLTRIIYIGIGIYWLSSQNSQIYINVYMLCGPRELSDKVLWLYKMPEMYPSNGIFILMQVVGFECYALYNNRFRYLTIRSAFPVQCGVFVPQSADQYIVRIYLIIFCCVAYNVNFTLIPYNIT